MIALILACARPERPETVVLVVLDTVRADADTPALAAIGASGLRFERAWAASPWTLPSHGSLFTGLDPAEHRCAGPELRCDPTTTSIAERFRSEGYTTAGFSNNPWVTRDTGLADGFDSFVEVFRSAYGAERRVSRFVDPTTTGLDDAGARRTVASVDRWLAAHPGPAFVFVNLIEAHLPYDPPVETRGSRRDSSTHPLADRLLMDRLLPDAFVGALSPADLAESRAIYDEEVGYVDDRLADLVAILDRHDRGDALLVVTSDHGEAFGAHQLGTIQLVDHQLSVYDELLHVPLAVRWPGRLTPASVPEDVSLRDVAPFFAWALEGGATPELLAARPGRAITASYAPPADLSDTLAAIAPGADPALLSRSYRVVRQGDDKLVAPSDGPALLFDVRADPGERQDLAALRPDTVRALTTLLPPVPPRTGAADPSVEALRALGYLR